MVCRPFCSFHSNNVPRAHSTSMLFLWPWIKDPCLCHKFQWHSPLPRQPFGHSDSEKLCYCFKTSMITSSTCKAVIHSEALYRQGKTPKSSHFFLKCILASINFPRERKKKQYNFLATQGRTFTGLRWWISTDSSQVFYISLTQMSSVILSVLCQTV